ncbi:MAG: hypothetical protein ACRCXX_14295 [Cetobacterium sp.]|uniref:hypothetical protein n=1 Tax=Cetobacterium sp. TaxID=2071632 RepID=UPI003F3FE3DD
MKVLKELGLQELIKNIKVGLNSKEPTISKKTGFNLVKTDSVENDTNKLFTAKGAFDLKTVITNAYTSLVNSTKSTLDTSIATKTSHGGYSGTSQQLKNEIDNKLPNPGYGGVHELGRYLDLHLSGSTLDFDTRISANTDKSLLIQNANGNIEIGPKNGTYCHIYTDRANFYFNKELLVNGNRVYHVGYKPGKADVGLGSVNNWGASSSIGANSTAEYATTNMVQQVNSKFGNTINWRNRLHSADGTSMDQVDCEFGFDYNTTNSGISGSYISFSGLSKKYQTQIVAAYSGGNAIKWRTKNGDANSWNPWREFWHTGNFDPNSKANRNGDNGQVFACNSLTVNGVANAVRYDGNYVRVGGGRWVMIDSADTGFMPQNSGTGSSAKSFVGNSSWWFREIWGNSLRGGTVNVTGTITGSAVYNAVWNDYAELFEKDLSQEYEAGDILSLKFSDEDKEEYHKSGIDCDTNVVGVYSDYFGHLIGGEQAPEGEDYVEHNLKKHVPIGLAGRVKPKIIGKVKKGDFVVTSSIPGVGRKYIKGQDDHLAIFGLVVENKDTDEISRVKVKIK